jgi:hypothetical protein
MDPRSMVLYLAGMEFSAITVYHNLIATLGTEPINYSSVTRYLRKAILVSSNSLANIPEAKPQFDDCDQAILLAPGE